ncbi:sulfatase-like hydrolase/transferase [Enterococcus sp. LJL98]
MKQPNILFILTDQQRKDTLSVYGDVPCFTPNLDQLAEESAVFDEAYASCPICTPARASLQTGLYPMHHGMITNSYNYGNMVQELADTPELLSRRLLDAGYQAGFTGKWHLGSGVENVKADAYIQKFMGGIQFPEYELKNDAVPTTRGYVGDDFPGHGFGGHFYPQFQTYLKEKGRDFKIERVIKDFYQQHQAGVITTGVESTIEHYLVERATEIIGDFQKKDQPWYFQLNFWGPHEPYFVPEEFLALYEEVEIPAWKNFHEQGSAKPRVHDVKRGNFREWSEIEPVVKHYLAGMTHIDAQIGRMLEYLKANDLYDDTVIIFSSDHGESLGIHDGLCDKAIFMYEETNSIPLFVKPAKGQTKEHIREFINTCDIYSTILDYAGVDRVTRERDGQSIRPLIEKEPIDWPDTVVTECSGIGSILFSQRMIRKGTWKYVFNCGDIDELYDLATDPYELDNKIDQLTYQKQQTEMRQALHDWMKQHQDNLIFEYEALRMRKEVIG